MSVIGVVTSKGQTTIPKVVRDKLRLKAGSRIEWQVVDDRASIVARDLRAIDLAGILGTPPSGVTGSTIQEMEEAMAAGLAEDDERISQEWRQHRE